MNPFDVAIIATIVVSALFAFVRGFLKEALSIVVWIGAGFVTYYAFPYVLPLALRITSEAWLAQAGAAICTFILALILLALLSATISTSVRGTALGPVDRVLGLLYGAVRGAVIACLLYIGVTALIGEPERPAWFTSAQSLPALARGAALLETVLPAGAKSLASQTVDTGKRAAESPAGTVLGSRPIIPLNAPILPAPTGPGATMTTTPPTSTPAIPSLSESDRLMRPPAPATPPVPDKPNYRNDDRRAMDRAFQSVQ